MKKILFILLAFIFSIAAYGQKILPEIKAGTVLNCSAIVNGKDFALTLTIKSITGPVSMGWSVDGYGEGSFDMSTKALESGTDFYLTTQPALGATKLSDAETFSLLSKTAYKALIDTKTFSYGGKKFKVKVPTSPMKLMGKDLDVSNVVSEDGKIELWILNNPNFPIIMQSAGFQTDILVNEVK